MSMESEERSSPEEEKASRLSRFLFELRRRKIITTLAAFIGGGWLILEVVHWILIDHYRLPERLLDIAIVTLLGTLLCTLIYQWFGSTEKKLGTIKVELFLIPVAVLITGLLDMYFLQTIGEHEGETIGIPNLTEIVPEKPLRPEFPDLPSIAVLPFTNMSGDPENEYLCDGIVDDIITNLSKTPKLFVIASNSSFTYKGKPVKVQQVSQELGVRYVLEGSLNRSGDRVRVLAQLIDATRGQHLWAETYDRVLEDVLSLQDDITRQIVVALQVQLTDGEVATLYSKGTKNFEAYMKYVQGYQLWAKVESKETNAKARQLLKEAIALDPQYATAYSKLAWTYIVDLWLGWSESPEQDLALAEELGRKTIALDNSNFHGHHTLGEVLAMKGLYDEGIAEGKIAIELAPNAADAAAGFASILQFSGRYEEALEYSKKTLRLSPFAFIGALQDLAFEYLLLGMYEQSIAECKRMIAREPDNQFAHQILAANYSLTGRDKEARAEAAEILRINPTYSQDAFENAFVAVYKDKASVQRFVDALRKAGLK